jgi:hypothetical protein
MSTNKSMTWTRDQREGFDQPVLRRCMRLIVADPAIEPDLTGDIDQIRAALIKEFGEPLVAQALTDVLLEYLLLREVELTDFGEYGDGTVGLWSLGGLTGMKVCDCHPNRERDPAKNCRRTDKDDEDTGRCATPAMRLAELIGVVNQRRIFP